MPAKIQFAAALVGLFLASAGIPAQNTSENPLARKLQRELSNTIKSENYTIYYGKHFEGDAQQVKTWLDHTISSLKSEFADYEPPKILKAIDCYVYLYPEPNEMASDGRSLCFTRGLDNGRRYAELHFLTPSRYGPNSKDSMGEPKDANHFFRYVVHEYASIWLGVIARGKEKGWHANGNDCPNWFWQGYEEYLGMTLSSEHSRTVTFAKYMAFVKNDPASVLLAYGYRDKTPRIVVAHDYTDGFSLLAFMHQQFGKKAVQSILASEKETFRDAMHDAFQMDDATLYEKYQQWVDSWKSP